MGPPTIEILSVVHVCRKLLIFSFFLLGCYWHGHDCQLNQGKEINTTRDKPLKSVVGRYREKQCIYSQAGFQSYRVLGV